MSVIMLVLVGLGIYAHEFVIAGIKAKVALNLSIFATFGLAAWLAFSHVLNLKNEVVALKALQVDYGFRTRRPLDPYRNPAIVFYEPELLGQGYRMITEELVKQDTLQITNATVQTLLHDVDQRINDRKSTIIYFSGLMVFLGLLGAFMGLMKTVHSVGDLIGGMDVSGGGGSDSFGKLIEGMKAPLNGMSVGFSSSLFGLMTSMVLGALERCMTSAMKTLRNEFEHWLSNVAELEGSAAEVAQQRAEVDLTSIIRALDSGSHQLTELRESVLGGVSAGQLAIAEMAKAVTQLSRSVEQVADPKPMLQPIADCVAELAQNQSAMVAQFSGLIHLAQQDRATIHAMLGQMQQTLERNVSLNGPQLHAQLERMVSLQSDLLDKEPVVITNSVYSSSTSMRGLMMERVKSWFGRDGHIARAVETRRDRRRLRGEVRKMLVNQRKFSSSVEKTLNRTISKIESGRASDHDAMATLIAQNDSNNALLAVLMDRLQMLDQQQFASRDDLELITGLHGARLEMDMLRRRLDLLQELESDQPDETAKSVVQPQSRMASGSEA